MNDKARQNMERGIWDKQAAGYDRRNLKIYEEAYDLSIQKVRAVLSPDHRVLEIGCGTGIISLGIAPFVESVVATDLSPQMIAVARSKAKAQAVSNVDFRVGDGYALPDGEQAFDFVLLFNVLHCVQDPGALLGEVHRLLKSSGQLLSATDCRAEPVPFPIGLMLDVQKLLHRVGIIPFLWQYEKRDLQRLFEQHSFTIVETDVLHPAPVNYYIRAQKV